MSERKASKEGGATVARRGSKVGRRPSKGRSNSKDASGHAAAANKQVYIEEVVTPILEQLSVMVFAENPMPLEDPVSFLIEKLVAVQKLKPPEAGNVDQKEVQKLRETTTWLRGKMAQIDVIEEKMPSFEDTDPVEEAAAASGSPPASAGAPGQEGSSTVQPGESPAEDTATSLDVSGVSTEPGEGGAPGSPSP